MSRLNWVLCLAAVACGGDKDSGEAFRFSELSDADKSAYMASDVLPTMAAVFQSYDSEAYADFSCDSCHVSGLADGTYAMPDAGLPPLSEDAFPYDAGVGLFMNEEVLPTLNDLLGPTTGGRPCTTCHTLTE